MTSPRGFDRQTESINVTLVRMKTFQKCVLSQTIPCNLEFHHVIPLDPAASSKAVSHL